jgi:hypothetical protein
VKFDREAGQTDGPVREIDQLDELVSIIATRMIVIHLVEENLTGAKGRNEKNRQR